LSRAPRPRLGARVRVRIRVRVRVRVRVHLTLTLTLTLILTTPKALLERPSSDGYRPAAGGSGAQPTLEAAQGGGAVRGRSDALRLDVGMLTLGSGVLRDPQVVPSS